MTLIEEIVSKLTPKQVENLLVINGDWDLYELDLFEYDEQYDEVSGDEWGWFEMTELGHEVRAYLKRWQKPDVHE